MSNTAVLLADSRTRFACTATRYLWSRTLPAQLHGTFTCLHIIWPGLQALLADLHIPAADRPARYNLRFKLRNFPVGRLALRIGSPGFFDHIGVSET